MKASTPSDPRRAGQASGTQLRGVARAPVSSPVARPRKVRPPRRTREHPAAPAPWRRCRPRRRATPSPQRERGRLPSTMPAQAAASAEAGPAPGDGEQRTRRAPRPARPRRAPQGRAASPRRARRARGPPGGWRGRPARLPSTASPQTMGGHERHEGAEELGVGVRAQRRVPSVTGEVLAAGKTFCQAADEGTAVSGERARRRASEQGPRESPRRGSRVVPRPSPPRSARTRPRRRRERGEREAQTARPASVSMPSAVSAPLSAMSAARLAAARARGG